MHRLANCTPPFLQITSIHESEKEQSSQCMSLSNLSICAICADHSVQMVFFPLLREKNPSQGTQIASQMRHKPVRVLFMSTGVCGFLGDAGALGETGFIALRPVEVKSVLTVAVLLGRESSTFGNLGMSWGTWKSVAFFHAIMKKGFLISKRGMLEFFDYICFIYVSAHV